MNDLSTDSFISQIGALEWDGGWESHGDAALEAAAGASMGLQPATVPAIVCPPRVDDAALEAAAGASLAPQATQNIVCLTRHIEDAALEAAGANLGPPLTAGLSCGTPTVACPRFID